MTAGVGGRRALGATILVAGLCALTAGIATVAAPGRAPADAGTVRPAAEVPGSARPTSGVPAAPSGSARPGRRTASPVAPVPATPTRVTIAALRVDAAVDAVSVGPGGALRIPEDPDRLGWWIGSAMPAAGRGTVVIAGHVDTVADGPGALFALETLPMGARIELRTADRVVSYRAVARRSYAKRRLPDDLFRTDTAPRLVLITCGGAFSAGTYSHNVVLYAEPLR